MEICERNKLMQIMKVLNKPFEICVSGNSMNPFLKEGDILTVQPIENCDDGSILVFIHDNEQLLVHRLLEKRDNKYVCKGDNSFRLEAVSKDKIIGIVVSAHRNGEEVKLSSYSTHLIQLSMAVHRTFSDSGYDIKKTLLSDVYKQYIKLRDSLLY